MIRIALVDDHDLVRAGVRRILEAEKDMQIVGEASTGADALDLLDAEDPDVLILDLSLPDLSGIDLMRSILARRPGLKVLIVSMHPEENYARRMMRAGAYGYLNKGEAPALMLEAIRKLSRGSRFVSPKLAELLAYDLTEDRSGILHERLSDREFEVFERLVRGAGISEVANELNLSPKTVSTHRSRILQKMNMRNNASLVRYAVENGLLD